MKKILLILAIIASVGFIVARTFVYYIDPEACTECGICLPVCEEDAIVFDYATFTYSIDPEKCTACGDCYATCNNGAISLITPNEVTPMVNKIQIYPNPATEKIEVSIDESLRSSESTKIEIFNVKGQCVKTIVSNKPTASWNLEDSNGVKVQAGVYLIKTTIGKKHVVKRVSIVK